MTPSWLPQDPVQPTVSLTESQGFQALRAFLTAVLPPGTVVIRAEQNRTAEPQVGDFVIMTQLAQVRLGTNLTHYYDNICYGSISGTTLNITDVTRGELLPGQLLTDSAYPPVNIQANTTIVKQLTGVTSGVGTYQVSKSQNLNPEVLYAGVRTDLAAMQWDVQLDVHGPNSGNNIHVIETLFRSEYATDFFAAQGFDVVPLYSEEPHQAPFINAEQQYEYRWSMDVHLQMNVVVGTSQQFADEVVVDTVLAGVVYTGPGLPLATELGALLTTETGIILALEGVPV